MRNDRHLIIEEAWAVAVAAEAMVAVLVKDPDLDSDWAAELG